MKNKIDEICKIISGTFCIAVMAFVSLGAIKVDTAPKGEILSSAMVVTNVTDETTLATASTPGDVYLASSLDGWAETNTASVFNALQIEDKLAEYYKIADVDGLFAEQGNTFMKKNNTASGRAGTFSGNASLKFEDSSYIALDDGAIIEFAGDSQLCLVGGSIELGEGSLNVYSDTSVYFEGNRSPEDFGLKNLVTTSTLNTKLASYVKFEKQDEQYYKLKKGFEIVGDNFDDVPTAYFSPDRILSTYFRASMDGIYIGFEDNFRLDEDGNGVSVNGGEHWMVFPVGVEGTIALREDIAALTNQSSVAYGNKSYAYDDAVAIGNKSYAHDGAVAIGKDSYASRYAVGIGKNAWGLSPASVAVGWNAKGQKDGAVAIGRDAYADAENSVQIHSGTNSVKNTLQFRDYQLVDAQGKIPAERLTAASILMKIKELNATELNELKTLLGIN